MVKRDGRRRWRRVLILALFLLIPALLSDLPLFSRTGHKPHAHGAPAAGPSGVSGGGGATLLPLDRGAWHPGHGGGHWHAASGAEGGDGDDDIGLSGGTLQNLVYRMYGDDADARQPDDGDWKFGEGGHDGGNGHDSGNHGGGSGGGGFGGGFGPSGFGGNDPGTDNPPFPFSPDGGPGNQGGDPPFFAPTVPTTIAAVPEPATWALFILGFGLIGAELRRARDARLAPARIRRRRPG